MEDYQTSETSVDSLFDDLHELDGLWICKSCKGYWVRQDMEYAQQWLKTMKLAERFGYRNSLIFWSVRCKKCFGDRHRRNVMVDGKKFVFRWGSGEMEGPDGLWFHVGHEITKLPKSEHCSEDDEPEKSHTCTSVYHRW